MIDSPSIGNWFPTPIYSDFAKSQQFDLIQQENPELLLRINTNLSILNQKLLTLNL